MKPICLNAAFTSLLVLALQVTGTGQDAPLTEISVPGNAIPGQQISANVMVRNFNKIGSVSLSMDYDYSKLHFVSATINSQLKSAGNFAIGDNDLNNGFHRFITGWYGSATTLPDNSAIITIIFTYITGSSRLHWFDNGASCAYTDFAGYFLNDLPTANYYFDGQICGTLTNPGIITGPGAVCSGSRNVKYNISPIPAATGYVWSVPSGSLIAGGQNTPEITIDYLSSISGNITVCAANDCGSGPVSSLPVTVLQPPVALTGNDTTILPGSSLTLRGMTSDQGLYNYHWSPENLVLSPDAQNTQTLNILATTAFKLLVTSVATQCRDSAEIIITISDVITGIYDSGQSEKSADNSDRSFIIYPNPVRDNFYLRINGSASKEIRVTVISRNGVLVKDLLIENENESGEYPVGTDDLRSGAYFLIIKSGGKSVMLKMIKL